MGVGRSAGFCLGCSQCRRLMCGGDRYCGVRSNLTIDHVRPTSKGGDWSWENLVTACVKCNGKKGDSTLKQLGWKLKKQPQARRVAAWI